MQHQFFTVEPGNIQVLPMPHRELQGMVTSSRNASAVTIANLSAKVKMVSVKKKVTGLHQIMEVIK